MNGVDVLAVMDKAARYAKDAVTATERLPNIEEDRLQDQCARAFERIAGGLAPMADARAAVAELIEAVDAVLPAIGQLDRRSNRVKYELDEDQMHTLQAALARVTGGAA